MQCLKKKKLTPTRFLSWCNDLTHISFHSMYNALRTKAIMFFKGKLVIARFPSSYYVFDDNVVVLYRKQPYEN